MTGVHRVPAVQLGDRAEVHEPVHLDRFPGVSRRVGGHAPADAGDALQLAASLRIVGTRGQLLGELRVTPGEQDHGVAADRHRVELREAVGIVGERLAARLDLGAVVEHPLAIDLAVERGVPRRALLHELGEDPRVVGVAPLVGHLAEDAIANRASAPVGDHLVFVDREHFIVDVVAGAFARLEGAQIVEAVARQLGEGGHHLRRGAALADDQLVVADPDRLPGAQLLERERAQHGDGVLPLVLVPEASDDPGAFRGDRGLGVKALVAQSFDSLVHFVPPPTATRKPRASKRAAIAWTRCSETSPSPSIRHGSAKRSCLSRAEAW